MKPATAILLLAVPLCGQRAQLAHKGRQPETGRAVPAEPLRKLPRRGVATALAATSTSPERPMQAAPALSEDRVRSLVRGSVTPLPAAPPVMELARTLPRLMPAAPAVAGVPATVKAESIRNRWSYRWKIFPSPPWRRYNDKTLDAIYATSRYWDPFNRNTIKGDYPVMGRKLFFAFTGTSDTTTELRRIPVPSQASSADPGEFGFFGRGEQFAIQQNFRFSFDLFGGAAGFKPVDFEVKITPEFNINYTLARENGLISVDVANGIRRTDTNIGMQEMYFEKRLWANKSYFDFTSVRVGIQRFTSDFRGFIFSDEQPGARLFGTFHNNVFQYNLAYFNMLEKDTNSGLNRWRSRRQQVYAANLYWSDFLTKGYTLNFSTLYNHDQPTFLVDKNGFLVRPAPIGFPLPHKISAGYAGVSGDGHIKRFTVSHAFYEAFGRDTSNPITAKPEHINAQLASFELGYEKDWMEFKASAFYTSGDRKLNDGHANGFDGIVPNQQFAGGGFLGNPSLADRGLLNNAFAGGGINFLNREAVPLSGTALILFGPNSLMPTMRAGLFEGQANFVNPGILLFNAAFNAKITPKLRGIVNVNWAKFVRTEILETVLFQSHIHHAIGLDTGIGVQYRPLLSDNLTVTAGVGTLAPGRGFKDLYTGRTLFSAFVNLRMVF
ncbi:MAG TPA: hypothetical protein VNY05_33645 [Candidatus Acidoferrales bacterium]|jgi:hypothetical protein|nr:hypothetical protein [Candidatus Acidoferrales bacterium]